MPKANIVDKSEPSHLSSILNLLRRRLFDAIQRPQKDIYKRKGCWVLWGLIPLQFEIKGRVVTDFHRAVTWHCLQSLHMCMSHLLKYHCKTVSLGKVVMSSSKLWIKVHVAQLPRSRFYVEVTDRKLCEND